MPGFINVTSCDRDEDFSVDSVVGTQDRAATEEDVSMLVFRFFGFRKLIAAGMLVASILIAPSAFARGHSHSSWSIGFSGPGYSVGYSDCRHCGGGHWSGNFYGGYYSPVYSGYPSYVGYGPVYYDYPRYYDGYVTRYPVIHHRPAVRRVVTREVRYYNDHGRRDHHRRDTYRNDHYYDRDGRAYQRASYYDRGH
jgi:hypothetical protein